MNYPKELLPTKSVFDQIIKAVQGHRGFSLVRFGDGETTTIGHNNLIDFSEVPVWLKNGYAGVFLPDNEIRLSLLDVVKQASVLGVPTENWPHFKFLMLRILTHYKINRDNLCHSRINFQLYRLGLLKKIIDNQDIIVVGRKAKESVEHFKKYVKSVRAFDLPNIKHLDLVTNKIKQNLNFSIALVAAGIPAKILCIRLAKLGKVSLDIGHVLDCIVNPKDIDVLKIMAEWSKSKK